MASRNNFGNRSRDMVRAVKNALNDAVPREKLSYQTARDYGQRFSQFATWLRDVHGIKYLEKITPAHLVQYGRQLADEVADGERSASSAQGLVSAINTTMRIASHDARDFRVRPTKDCGIANRTFVRTAPTVSASDAVGAVQSLRDRGLSRAACVAELAVQLGLRSKEASLLDAKRALGQAEKTGKVRIEQGTKGGRARTVPAASQGQLQALRNAADIQGTGRSIMPHDQNYKQWMNGGLREGRETLREALGIDRGGYHELRATYAAARYQEITGHQPACNGGSASNTADRTAREIISRELGHGRIDVTTAYLGGRK